jgi:hypothetical protein
MLSAAETGPPREKRSGRYVSRLIVVSSRYCSEIFSDLFAFDLRCDPNNAAATC